MGHFRRQADRHVGRQYKLGQVEVRRDPVARAFARQNRECVASRVALLSQGWQQRAVLSEPGFGQRNIDLRGAAIGVGHAHEVEVFHVVGQQFFDGLHLRIRRRHQQRLTGDVTGQGQVRRFVAMLLQIGKRFLLLHQALVAAERVQVKTDPWPDRIEVGDGRLFGVMNPLTARLGAKIDLRVQRTFRRRHRGRRLANGCIRRHQFKVARNGPTHHRVELLRTERRPPVTADLLAQVNLLVATLTEPLFGLLIVVLRLARRRHLVVGADGTSGQEHQHCRRAERGFERLSVDCERMGFHLAHSTKTSWPQPACEGRPPVDSPPASPPAKS
ncbi:hypothetical protein D3C84_640750 [compost metagenome]